LNSHRIIVIIEYNISISLIGYSVIYKEKSNILIDLISTDIYNTSVYNFTQQMLTYQRQLGLTQLTMLMGAFDVVPLWDIDKHIVFESGRRVKHKHFN
jgi:hypothetical protein